MLYGDKDETNTQQTTHAKAGKRFSPDRDYISQFRQSVNSGGNDILHKAIIDSFGDARGNIKTSIVQGKDLSLEVDSLLFFFEEDNRVTIASMLLDEPGKELGNQVIKSEGREISIPIVYGDLIVTEDDYINSLNQYLTNRFPNKKIAVAMYSVLPALMLDIDKDGKLPAKEVDAVWIDVEVAIKSLINDHDFPLEHALHKRKLKFRPDYPSDEKATSTGLPLFTEWQVQTKATQSRGERVSKAAISTDALTTISGYTNFVFTGVEDTGFNGRTPSAKTWQYNFYINAVKSELGYANLQTTLLGIASFGTMMRGENLFVPLRKLVSCEDRPLNSLNRDFDPKLDKDLMFDTTQTGFNITKWREFYLHDDIRLHLMIPECNEQTTFLQPFELAAGRSSGDDYDYIYNQMVALTARHDEEGNRKGSYFEDEFEYGAPICHAVTENVHLAGYWTDNNDVEHDIAGFNYAAARAAFGQDSLFEDYDATFVQTERDLERRLSDRVRILREQFPNVVFTHRERLVEIDPEFAAAAWAAITAAAGGNFEIESTHEADSRDRRSAGRLLSGRGINTASYDFNSRQTAGIRAPGNRSLRSTRSNNF